MKSIRSKLLIYFFVFVILFNVVSISIYVSSKQLMSEYNTSFERFLILNSVSSTSRELYEKVHAYVVEKDYRLIQEFYDIRSSLERNKEKLEKEMHDIGKAEVDKYIHMIDTLIQEGELTIGFAIQDDIDLYTYHLNETQNTSGYIQETTLNLIDLELTEYQTFYKNINERNEAFKWFTVFLFTNTMFLALYFAIRFSRGVNRPIQELTSMAKEVSSGNLEGKDLNIQSNDEFKLLGETFNQMRSSIRHLIEEIKEKSELDRLLKELELKHLQNQVNPHFLFNTLNTVSRMAYLEDASETSRLIDSISSLLRYSLGDLEKAVSLKNEVKVVQDYFFIQNVRFSDRITFSSQVDESCLDLNIPRLTLQPLVENAFIHGVEENESGGEISLTVKKRENKIIVEIADNGAGMTKEQVHKIMSPMNGEEDEHTGHSTGLGLQNVIRRLQLFYQREDVVEIYSKKGKGTTVRLFLPIDSDQFAGEES